MRASFPTALRSSIGAWLDDRAPTLAGALSFATIFALAPIFVIIMALTGHFISNDAVQQHLINQASHAVGKDGATALRAMVVSARANATVTSIFGVIGWLTLLGAASGLFLTLQDALNIIWHVEARKNVPVATLVRERAGALAMVFAMAILLVITFAMDAAIAVAVTFLQGNATIAAFGWLIQIASTLVSLAIATALFAIAFKVLPQARVAWRNVWEGAALSGVLFIGGQWAIALFLRVAGLTKGYGAAGSVLALLMWIYLSAMFLFLGAELVKYRTQEAEVDASSPPTRVARADRRYAS